MLGDSVPLYAKAPSGSMERFAGRSSCNRASSSSEGSRSSLGKWCPFSIPDFEDAVEGAVASTFGFDGGLGVAVGFVVKKLDIDRCDFWEPAMGLFRPRYRR